MDVKKTPILQTYAHDYGVSSLGKLSFQKYYSILRSFIQSLIQLTDAYAAHHKVEKKAGKMSNTVDAKGKVRQ